MLVRVRPCRGLIVGFGLLLVPGLAAAAPSAKIRATASAALSQLGVARYDAETRDGKQYVVLFDHDGKEVAGVVRRTAGPREIVHIEQPGDAYSLVWNQRTGLLRLRTSEGLFVLKLGEAPSPEARAAYERRGLPIRAAVTALDEISHPPAPFDLRAELAKSNSRPLYCQGSSRTGYAVSTYAVTGALEALVSQWLGFSATAGPVEIVGAFTGSQLCEAARERANLGCWNSYCTGCCGYDDCATLCLDFWNNQEFFCAAASIMGYSCSQLPPTLPPSGDGGGGDPGPFHETPDPDDGAGTSAGNCCSWINQSDCSDTSSGCTVHWVCTSYSC
jgi:hypothetical protein